MSGPLVGVKVVEVASHVFVPMAGAVLAEWGAEVVKIEHPETGDPYRGLVTAGLHKVHAGVDVQFQAANRGKRSVGLDLKHPEGRQVLSKMVAATDVFVTNLRPEARHILLIDVEDLRADNPALIYVAGSAFGPLGPDADRGGYDAGAYWARSGMQNLLNRHRDSWPPPPPPAYGDVVGGLTIAGAVSAALYRRRETGEPSVIEASLLASGMWQIQMDIVNAWVDTQAGPGTAGADQAGPGTAGAQAGPGTAGADQAGWPPDRYRAANPLMLSYRTADGRYVVLQMLSSDRHWPDLCLALGRPDMADDPRFADMGARRANARALVTWLDEVFAGRDYEYWKAALADFPGEWAPSQQPGEMGSDPQVVANGYLPYVDLGPGATLPLVAVPVQFDGPAPAPKRAPEQGEHTEEVLLELGLTWAEITALKAVRAVL